MRIFTFILITLLIYSCSSNENNEATTTFKDNPKMKLTYPNTETVDQKDNYFGNEVADPYRWLEIDTASEVEAWVNSQNAVTFDYLEKIPFRDKIRERMEDLLNYPRLSSPYKAGEYYFFYKNNGLQNQSVIYIQKGLDGEPEVFLDPNTMSEDGTASIGLAGFSDDYKYVAYTRSDAGSDWSQIHVMEIATKQKMDDVLEWCKFTSASWWKNGFFYSRYPEPAKGAELSGDNKYHSIFYHELGTSQSEDKLIYRDDENPDYYHFGGVTEDEKYFVMFKQPGTDGFSTFYKDLEKGDDFVELFGGFKNKSSVVHHQNGKFLVQTDIDAPNYRLIEVDLANPSKENWKEIIPETTNLLEDVNTGGGKLFATYLEKATTRIYCSEYDGSSREEIKLPGLGSASGLGGREDNQILFYTFTSFTYPPTVFKYDVQTGESSLFRKAELKFDPEDYMEKQVMYKSKDGTEVSMFIVHKKDLKLDGNNPTYLYGYGGFNVNLTPSFSTIRIVFLENGGVFAMPNLRGGGEYGEEWHKAGMLSNKQNVFDDFIAAGEYLINEKYTSSDKLAIAGGSNGGLLVGACMTQRPDLFAVALPAVGVMDMLRYHKFTVGKGWIPEYGSSERSEEEFKNLIGYSPLHNLKEGVSYPATMVTTADHDDRVVPAHSFKFAAQLQKSHKGENPVIIRIEQKAGHGAGKPISKVLDEQADIWSFVFYNTNAPVKYLDN
ncbi:MAG: prolyl oligopeptidase family serine peptidase [Bacteroidetes bacterium]|jgi:prolyl oligopeptidase|nr:prolyl oligopeptidase family serine peptidase [Bacteroidota bacterium]MDF1864486.1 prolyl oligopeptidase family serine peptidase [Saprospiraceae bacterium]